MNEAKTLTLADSGIGMNHDELIQNLGTIAHWGAKAFSKCSGTTTSHLKEIISVGIFPVRAFALGIHRLHTEVTVTPHAATTPRIKPAVLVIAGRQPPLP